ncbi:hypothetical protein HD554DRAFT_2116212 [Boletus coccyginus]|nr:hypothetical protein HD554DRAFT_2116212 [Boletus coccyginus]
MPPKSHSSTHPPWTDMITECIATTPDGTRHGVSRLAIKKFVDSKYHFPMNAAATSQLNRAITHGTHSGNFVLPKGPSGKVKLAPKKVGGIAKENKKPPSKRLGVTKPRVPPVSTTKTELPSFTNEQPSKTMPRSRKYTSMAKKARVTPIPGRKLPPRKPTTKRGGAERVSTRSSATATARTRSATRGAAKAKKRTIK